MSTHEPSPACVAGQCDACETDAYQTRATRRKRLLHLAERLDCGGMSQAEYLDLTQELITEAQLLLAEQVQNARESMSWGQIGAALGVSRQAAQKRFTQKRPPAPDPEQMTLVP